MRPKATEANRRVEKIQHSALLTGESITTSFGSAHGRFISPEKERSLLFNEFYENIARDEE
jgi:hypothetical protein